MEIKVPDMRTGVRRLSRFNVILVVILIVQIILTVVLLLPNGSTVEQSQGPLLKGFNPDSVTGVTIHDKNDTAQLVLTKDPSGNWVLPNADNYPVSNAQMTTLLGKIKGLDTNRLIAQNASSQTRLEVAPDTYEKLIEVTSGGKTDKIYLGSSEGTNATHTRLNDNVQVYLTSGLATSDASNALTTWIDTPYFAVTQENVTKFTVVNKQGTFEFDKGANALWTWTALGKNDTLNSTTITNTLGQASSITLQIPLGKTEKDGYGMKDPLATITMVTETSASVTPTAQIGLGFGPNGTQAPTPVTAPTKTVQTTVSLVIGAKQADGNYVAKSSTSDYYVEISSGVAEALTNLKPSDLITPSATGTPAATQSAASAGAAAGAEATTAATSAATTAATPAATLVEPATVAASPAPVSTLAGTAQP